MMATVKEMPLSGSFRLIRRHESAPVVLGGAIGEGAMRKVLITFFAVVLTFLSLASCQRQNQITQDELVRRTRELFDSVAEGDRTPWRAHFAEDCMYFDEKGRNMDKAALVADVSPLPSGYSGSIRMGKVQSHIEENVAILSYDLDEKEKIYGQEMSARYHATDTWMRRGGKWQIVAGQMFRYYEDPAPGKLNPAGFAEYLGTYELAPGNRLTIRTDGRQLYRQRGDRPTELLIPEATSIFFRKGVEGRLLFRRSDNQTIDTLIDRRNNEDVVWKRVK
jgi:hypothetical protein